jgi:parallel beta-helix repeat protein
VIEYSNITGNGWEGGLGIEDSRNITLRNNVFIDNEGGCIIQNSDKVSIENNIFTLNVKSGLLIEESTTNVTVKFNRFIENPSGISVRQSLLIEIIENEFYFNGGGFSLNGVSQVTVENNKVFYNTNKGIYVIDSNAVIEDNEFISNGYTGIELESKLPVKIKNNKFTSDGINFNGYDVEDFNSHTISSDNILNGKSILYYINETDLELDNIDVGQLIIANCSKIKVSNLDIEDTACPLLIAFVDDGIVENNDFFNNTYGIKCYYSNYLTIAKNLLFEQVETGLLMRNSNDCIVKENSIKGYYQGLGLSYCNRNLVYHNNFLGGRYLGAYDTSVDDNQWDAGYPTGGNYWGRGEDYESGSATPQKGPGSDGICDDPIEFDHDTIDRYPLANPWGSPSAPLNFTIKHGPGYMNLTWDKPLSAGKYPITNYVIYRSEEIKFEVGIVYFYNETNLSLGYKHRFKVCAQNRIGNGQYTEMVGVVALGLPGVPLDVKADSKFDYISISWSTPEYIHGRHAAHYRIYRGISLDDLNFYTDVGNVLTFIDNNVEPGITYYYKISAVNDAGEGNLSESAYGIVYSVPGEPLNLTIEKDGSQIILSWDEPLLNGGYIIDDYYVYRSDGIEEIPYFNNGDIPEFIDYDTYDGVRYHYRITAVNGKGEGPSSKSVSIYLPEKENIPPEVSILINKTTGYAPFKIAFISSSSDDDGNVTSFEWDFGDGGTISEQNPEYTFQNPGEYMVKLKVIDDKGAYGIAVVLIKVEEEQPSETIEGDEKQEGSDPSLTLAVLVMCIMIVLIVITFIYPTLSKKGSRSEVTYIGETAEIYRDGEPLVEAAPPEESLQYSPGPEIQPEEYPPQAPPQPLEQQSGDYPPQPQQQAYEQPPQQYPQESPPQTPEQQPMQDPQQPQPQVYEETVPQYPAQPPPQNPQRPPPE